MTSLGANRGQTPFFFLSKKGSAPYFWIIELMLVVALVVAPAGCGPRGGYYKDDGPPRGISKADIEKIPDAVPKIEPLSKTGNRPYTALGKKYYPMKSAHGYKEKGAASWYGKKFHGARTSSGEKYDMLAMTAAHRTLPLPTYVKVRSLKNGRSVIVKVNDRGPFLHNRVIDLSYAAAYKLGVVATGTGLVEVTTVTPASSRQQASYPVQVPLSTRSVSGPQLYVQYGAFSVRSNAQNLQHRLSSHGFDTFIEPGTSNGGDIYRVRAGPYRQLGEVDQLTARSNRIGYETKLVVE